MKQENNYKWGLLKALKKISPDKKLLDEFLKIILTPKEYGEIILRWQIIKHLNSGMSQREIAKKLNVSIAKITRGSKELQKNNKNLKKLL